MCVLKLELKHFMQPKPFFRRNIGNNVRTFYSVLLAACLAGVMAFSARANMIQNADFSDGLADWNSLWTYSYNGSGGQSTTGSQNPDPFLTASSSGFAFTYNGPYFGSEYLSQTISTTPGQTYVISFWAQNSGYNTGQSVSFGNLNVNLGNILGYSGALEDFVFTVTATSADTTLLFGTADDIDSISRFGNISITAVSDSASTIFLLAGAFGGIVLIARKYAFA